MSHSVRIGILGDFNPEFRSHHATNDALQHAAAKLKVKLQSEWIATPSVLQPHAQKMLERFDGLWASPGSPFLGTCGGVQYTLIECARNVLGIKDADTAENDSGSKNIIIYPVECAVPNRAPGAPKLSGAGPEIRLRPGSYLQSLYLADTVVEEFFCNFEANPEFEWCSIEAGFPVTARGPKREVRAIESPTHRFSPATLFQPQLSSKPEKPHPLVLGFVQSAADWKRKRLDDGILA